MKKGLKTVTKAKIVFENGEVATVKADDIGVMEISGISDKVVRTPNGINEMTVAENILIEFKPEANTEYGGFGKDVKFKTYLFEILFNKKNIITITRYPEKIQFGYFNLFLNTGGKSYGRVHEIFKGKQCLECDR